MTQTITALGGYFIDTDSSPCDGQRIQVYNRTHAEVEADIAAYFTYAPLCIGDVYGTTIDASGWNNPDVNELFCILLNDANKSGNYTFYLYHEGNLTFSFPVHLGIGWSGFWYAGNGEVPGNGNYQVDIRDPDGIAVATRTFTLVNYPTPKFKIRAMENTTTPISGATVLITDIGTKVTDSEGYTDWFYADYGTYLDVYITATGYEPFSTGAYFSEGEDGMIWTHYLTPLSVLCNQLCKVVNPAIEPIEGATIIVPISESESTLCYTDASGLCYAQGLTIGSIYTACANKAGYEQYDADGCKSFTACSDIAVLLTLYKPCEQGFGVHDQDNNPIEGATVTLTGGDTCTTDANGYCSISLDADLSYDAEATKEGYVCFGSECRQENFTCIPYSSLPLKLQERAGEGIIESISCTATKEAEEKYEISVNVTIKNTDIENHSYEVRLFDNITNNEIRSGNTNAITPGNTETINITTFGYPEASTTTNIRYQLHLIKLLTNPIIESATRTEECPQQSLGEILNITCSATKEAENEYEISAIVKFNNPDTISHLYKVELLDAQTGESKDHEPNIYESGKEVAPGATTTIVVNTIGGLNCISPNITIKLWETTGFKALADEEEKDCSAEDSIFATLISFLMEHLNLSEPQAKLLVYGSGGVLALSFIMPLFRR